MTDISPIEIADATDTTAGTVYYPSASGFSLGHYTHLGIEIEANDVTLSLEASMSGSSWEDITVAVVDAPAFPVGTPMTLANSPASCIDRPIGIVLQALGTPEEVLYRLQSDGIGRTAPSAFRPVKDPDPVMTSSPPCRQDRECDPLESPSPRALVEVGRPFTDFSTVLK